MNPTLIHTQSGFSELKLFFPFPLPPTDYSPNYSILWKSGWQRYLSKGRMETLVLFNSASDYPITLFAVAIITACT